METTPTTTTSSLVKGQHYAMPRAEYDQCLALAAERQRRNDEAGVVDHRRSRTLSSVDIHAQGLLGEWAFLRMAGQDTAPLFNTQPRGAQCHVAMARVAAQGRQWVDRARPDEGHDGMVDGYCVDVKTVLSPYDDLRVQSHKLGPNVPAPHVYVLMRLLDDRAPDQRLRKTTPDAANLFTPELGAHLAVEFVGAVEQRRLLTQAQKRDASGFALTLPGTYSQPVEESATRVEDRDWSELSVYPLYRRRWTQLVLAHERLCSWSEMDSALLSQVPFAWQQTGDLAVKASPAPTKATTTTTTRPPHHPAKTATPTSRKRDYASCFQ